MMPEGQEAIKAAVVFYFYPIAFDVGMLVVVIRFRMNLLHGSLNGSVFSGLLSRRHQTTLHGWPHTQRSLTEETDAWL